MAKALVVGMSAVPIIEQTLAKHDGQFMNVPMVDLSRVGGGWALYQWLWKPLGVPRMDWDKGAPWKLPLMQELLATLAEARGKRGRDGKFRDALGNLLPELLEVNVRGHHLQVLNDARKLLVNLAEEDDMKWFVEQLWQDLHPAPIQGSVVGVLGDAPDSGSGDAPGDSGGASCHPAPLLRDAPDSGDAAGDSGGASSAPADRDIDQEDRDALEQAMESLRAHGAVRSVSFDQRHGRFRVVTKDGLVKYAPIKKYKKMRGEGMAAFQASMDMALEEFLENLAA